MCCGGFSALADTIRNACLAKKSEADELFDDCSVVLRGVGLGTLRHADTLPAGKKSITAMNKAHEVAGAMLKMMKKL